MQPVAHTEVVIVSGKDVYHVVPKRKQHHPGKMIDIITVVFQPEIPLLKIQAQSIDRYISPLDVNQIIVVVNDRDSVVDQIDPAWWGQHQSQVVIYPYSQFKYVARVGGWQNQQLCKLMAAADAESDWSMVLDAKTWFVQPLNLSTLYDDTGRPRVGAFDISPYFANSLGFTQRYYNVTMSKIIGPAGVPFMFHTDTVKEMIDQFDNFPEFFQSHVNQPTGLTEFYLYSGYVLHKYGTYQTLYNEQDYYQYYNVTDWQSQDFDKIYQEFSADDRVLTASIQGKCYKKLTIDDITQWVDFLIQRNVIVDDNKYIMINLFSGFK